MLFSPTTLFIHFWPIVGSQFETFYRFIPYHTSPNIKLDGDILFFIHVIDEINKLHEILNHLFISNNMKKSKFWIFIACRDRLIIPIMCDILHIINKDHNIGLRILKQVLNNDIIMNYIFHLVINIKNWCIIM